jgi:hypothetical protein
MKRIVTIGLRFSRLCLRAALICLPALLPGATRAADAQALNTAPLTFGMTQQEASDALGAHLTRVAVQRHGRAVLGEVYFADRDARVPGYPTGEHVFLQFRRGRLTGWKMDWAVRPHGLF